MNGQSAVSDAEAAGSDAFADGVVMLHWEARRARSLREHQESRREEYGPSALSEIPPPLLHHKGTASCPPLKPGAIPRKKRRWRKNPREIVSSWN